jgi:hypothetical protein
MSNSGNNMSSTIGSRYCVRFGCRSGIWLSCIYASILGVVWVYTEPGIEMPEQRIFGFFWFSFYGWIVGSVIGSILGAMSGYFICKVLERVRPYIKGQAWLVGLVVCTAIWLVIYLAIDYMFERALASETNQAPMLAFPLLVVCPSIIYIVAGAVLSQCLYSCTVIGRRALRLSR